MFRRSMPSTYARPSFPDQETDDASQKNDRAGPHGERQCRAGRDAYLFVDGKQEIGENVYCRRSGHCQPDGEKETVFERRFYDSPVELGCAPLPDSSASAIRVFDSFSLLPRELTACRDRAHQPL